MSKIDFQISVLKMSGETHVQVEITQSGKTPVKLTLTVWEAVALQNKIVEALAAQLSQ